MQKVASNELDSRKPHEFKSVRIAVVAPAKGDEAIIHVNNAVVGNGDLMGVAPKIVDDIVRAAKRRLAVSDPVRIVKAGNEAGVIRFKVERFNRAAEFKVKPIKGVKEFIFENL